MKRKKQLIKICTFLFVLIVALTALFPFYWMFITAVKPVGEIFAFPPKLWPSEFMFGNFAESLKTGAFDVYYKNSLIVTSVATIITISINLWRDLLLQNTISKGKISAS